MSLVFGAFTLGLILSLLSLGMLLTFRMIRFTDITVDGSLTLGASVAAVLISGGMNPWIATFLAILGGACAGGVTGLLHTRWNISGLLSGILVMTGLYSVNLRIMGKSNIPLLNTSTVSAPFEKLLGPLGGASGKLSLFGWPLPMEDGAVFLSSLLFCLLAGGALHFFLRTHLGTGLRGAGNNPQMARAQGLNDKSMILLGLAISNGLVALAGALLAQYQGFADIQMGIGMMVWGLASIILGEALVRPLGLGLLITGTVMGTILFRLLVAIALRWGLNPNDLKLVTTGFVFLALVAPQILKKREKSSLPEELPHA